MKNLNKKNVDSFSDQWIKYDQSNLNNKEASKLFKVTFQFFLGKNYLRTQRDLILVVEQEDGLVCGT